MIHRSPAPSRKGTDKGGPMAQNRFSGELGSWSPGDADAFEQAVEIYRALLAVLDARLDRETDPAAADDLRAATVRYAAERRQLDPADRIAVAKVISEYPA